MTNSNNDHTLGTREDGGQLTDIPAGDQKAPPCPNCGEPLVPDTEKLVVIQQNGVPYGWVCLNCVSILHTLKL